ncbi:MAG TPA: Imm51 family immunity protein [Polyangia bacterium]|nr:Imm51 family immunity protein [Polyangia bacterium]
MTRARASLPPPVDLLLLRRPTPGRRTKIHEAPDTPSDPLEPMFVAGTWSVFADLAALLGTKNNYDAERAVRRRLQSVAPDLGRRLEFDSEAGAFGANTTSRADIQRLAEIIRSMTTAGGASG